MGEQGGVDDWIPGSGQGARESIVRPVGDTAK